MRLTLRLFAGLRERAGVSEFVLEDCPAELTVGGLKRLLAERHPELGDLSFVRGVVGTEYADDERAIAPGETVALLPPVSGGSGRTEGARDCDAELERGVFELSADPLDPAELARRVEHPGCGAVVVFAGNVRDHARGKDVVHLVYEAFEAMAGPEMARIFDDCRAACGALGEGGAGREPRRLRMLCAHRVGHVGIGEPAVVIAVASPHREAAFQAARFLIDELKARLPVWKQEVYGDGRTWIGDRS